MKTDNKHMKCRTFFLFLTIASILSGCGSVKPTTINRNPEDDLKNYTYFYVNPTGSKNSSTGVVTDNGYGLFGVSSTRSTDPIDIISGYLMKLGYVRIAEIDEKISDKTLVISYGEIGKRPLNLGYAIEVTMQFTSAESHALVCSVTGEGQGETEADDIRIAITRCLDTVFGVTQGKAPTSSRQF